jgi:hypothetical protein
LDEALTEDIKAVLRSGGRALSVTDVAWQVAPLRVPEVRAALNALFKEGVLDLNRGGGGWPALYGRRPIARRF